MRSVVTLLFYLLINLFISFSCALRFVLDELVSRGSCRWGCTVATAAQSACCVCCPLLADLSQWRRTQSQQIWGRTFYWWLVWNSPRYRYCNKNRREMLTSIIFCSSSVPGTDVLLNWSQIRGPQMVLMWNRWDQTCWLLIQMSSSAPLAALCWLSRGTNTLMIWEESWIPSEGDQIVEFQFTIEIMWRKQG